MKQKYEQILRYYRSYFIVILDSLGLVFLTSSIIFYIKIIKSTLTLCIIIIIYTKQIITAVLNVLNLLYCEKIPSQCQKIY